MLKAIRQTFYFIFVDQKVNFQNKNTILLEISFKKIHISTIYGIFLLLFYKNQCFSGNFKVYKILF